MQAFVALLRAVNVGGTGKLAMADLRAVCERRGYEAVRTYIASGNVLFRSPATKRRSRPTSRSRWPRTPVVRWA